jgi:hypothetical protein
MPITLDCPQCQAHFMLPDSFAGRQLKCQKCGRMFEAPAAPQPAPRSVPRTAAAAAGRGDAILDAEVVDDDAPALADTGATAHAIQTSPRAIPAAGPTTDEGRGEPRRRREEPDDYRRGRRVYRERDDSSVALWVAAGIVGGVIFIVLVAVAAWLMLRSAPVALAPAPPPMPPRGAAVKQPVRPPIMFPGMMQPGAGPVAIVGNDRAIKIAFTKGAYQGTHRLEPNDPIDPMRRQFCKVFVIQFEQGKNYVIDHIPAKENFFDAWLRLEKNPGQQLMEDDDGGDGLNSRIHFNCNETGDYRIIATSLGGGLGAFTITVKDKSAPEPAPTQPLANIALPQPDAVPQQLQVNDGLMGKLPVKTIQLGQLAGNVCVAPDGQSFYVLGSGGLLRQIALRDLTDVKRIALGNGCRSLTLSAAGLAVAAVGPGEVWVLDPATLSIKHRISVPGVQDVVSGPATSWGYALFQKQHAGPDFNQRHVHVLDLAKGASVHRLSMMRFQHFVVADAENVLTVGEVVDNDCLVRHRVQADGTLARVQASPRLGNTQTGIVLSRDGKYACLPTLGNVRIGGGAVPQQAIHVFETQNLLQPAFSIPLGSSVRAVGLDTDASFAYAVSQQGQLSVFNFKGGKLADHGRAQGEQAEQIVALAPRKLAVRYSQRLVIAELAEDGRQVGAPPLPKVETRTVDDVVRIEDMLTPEDLFDDDRRANYKQYDFRFEANTTYTIDHETRGFDAYLFLYDDNGVLLRQDDDSGDGLNSRIVFTAPRSGVYRIHATSLGQGKGSYVLTVRKGATAPGAAAAPEPPRPAPRLPTKSLIVTTKRNPATADEELRVANEPRLFTTSLKANAVHTIEVKAQGFTPAVKLLGFKGELLQEARAKEAGDVRLVYQPAASQLGRIEVTAADGKTGRFTISLRREP